MSAPRKNGGAESSTVRLSVTLPADEHRELKRLSAHNRVSVAWLIRDAVTDYLKSAPPLFTKAGRRD